LACADFRIDKPSPGSLLRDFLLEMDAGGNARRECSSSQRHGQERDAQLARNADKIATLRR
jgi:hypothetical protein